jgi:ATP-dependent DNA helicase RecQ
MAIDLHLRQLGLSSLKEKQIDLINCFIRKEDSIGVLPTGYGKSICYILPYLLRKKNVIVISPLISLMEDQRRKLNEKGINTISFNSAKHFDSFNDKLHIKQLKTKEFTGILYFSPESFMNNQSLIELLLSKKLISLFAIDECHCITSWSDFRSNYAELGIIRSLIDDSYKVPIMALTATATIDTIIKIQSNLDLDITYKNGKENIIKGSFAKDKLSISFQKKIDITIDSMSIKTLIKTHNCKTIIYCKTKKETENISDRLNKLGINVKYYHAGLDTKSRTIVQEEFTNGTIDVITATIAFGMGIDIPTIYLVIHYGISKDIESYYQEIGRAGRDGSESTCHLFWSEDDFRLNKYFISLIKDPELKQSQSIKIKQVQDFIYSNQCRMKFMLNYFSEQYNQCKKCDNCLQKNKNPELPNNIYIYIILKSLIELKPTNNSGIGIGITKLLNILFGSTSKELTSDMKKLSTYGIYNANTNKLDIKNVISILFQSNLIKSEIINNKYNMICYSINDEGRNYYNLNKFRIKYAIQKIILFAKSILPKCNKKNIKSNMIKSKPAMANKRWTTHDDNLLNVYIQQMNIDEIASKLNRSKQSIEKRIVNNIDCNKISFNILKNCKFIPSSTDIKLIKEQYSNLSEQRKLKDLKDKIPSTCNYFDINIALSSYGKIF